MQVKSIHATDYSSGTEYQYSDRSGDWQSIKAVGGQVNHQGTGSEIFSVGSDDIVTSSSGTSIRLTHSLLLVVVMVSHSMTLLFVF